MFVTSVTFMSLFGASMVQAEDSQSLYQQAQPRRLRSEIKSTDQQPRRDLVRTHDTDAFAEEAEMFWNKQERWLESSMSMSMSMPMPNPSPTPTPTTPEPTTPPPVPTPVIAPTPPMPTENLNRCLEPGEFDPNVDYFPQKVEATGSERWSIEYFDSYKIVTQLGVDEEYLLIQCGAQEPDDLNLDLSRFKVITEVPLTQGIGLTGVNDIALMERAGRGDDIAYIGNPEFIGSPCLNELIDNGEATVLNGVDWTIFPIEIEEAFDEYQMENPKAIVLTGGTPGEYDSDKTMVFDTFFEEGNFDRFEWIKVIGALYNDEELTNNLVDSTEARYQCISSKAEEPETPITVAWGFFSTFGSPGWDVANPCDEVDNYYCQLAEACGVKILSDARNSLTNEQFANFTKDADVLIYPSSRKSFQDVIEAAPDNLFDDHKYVVNEAVFDILKSGDKAWFERSPSDYDNLLFDFCDAAGVTFRDGFTQERKYLRNIYSEADEVGNLGECDDPSAPWIPEGSQCVA